MGSLQINGVHGGFGLIWGSKRPDLYREVEIVFSTLITLYYVKKNSSFFSPLLLDLCILTLLCRLGVCF